MMNTAYEAYSFPSADGVSQCAGIAVLPPDTDNPKALFLISHGMSEHMKRYLPFMHTLAGHGFLCFGHDHIGHGATASTSADHGYLPRKTGAEIVVSDLICDANRFRACYPDLPLVLFGHSMGSFIARLAAAGEQASIFDALILSGTGAKNPLAPLGMTLLTVLSLTRGERTYSARMQSLLFDSYSKPFEKRTPYDWISSDPSAVDRYIADPWNGFAFTVSAQYVLISLLHRCNQPKTFQNTPNELPILLISGRDDPVGNFGNGIHAVADAYQNAGCSSVSHTLYTGARHELLQEPIAAEVINDLLCWLASSINVHPKRSTPT